MDLLIFVIGLISMIVALVVLIINAVRKRPKKVSGIAIGVSVVLMMVGLFMGSPDNNQNTKGLATEADSNESIPEYDELTMEEVTVLKKHFKDLTTSDTVILEGIIEKSKNISPDEFDIYYENITRIDEEMAAFEDKHKSETESKSEQETEPTAETETKKDVPKEYQSALKKAYIYSDTMHMSKAGLYEQLVSEYGEDFSDEAAQYAIDNIVADWEENALQKAILYQDSMSMSPNAIYDQLISEHGEGFTKEEAQYAVDNLPE